MNDSSSDSEDSYIPIGLSKINLGKFANIRHQTCNVLVKSISTDSFNLIPELQYEYLLNRAEEFLKKNTKLNKKNIKLIVTRKNKKTQVNVEEVAIQLNRQSEHLSKYILKGLFSEGNINDKGILNIDGRFVQSEVENLIKRFINEFVICKSCESIDNTVIIKKNRLFFVHCNDCNSERCVGNIIEGLNLNKL